jgi:ribose transport system substrate-binding protein
MAYYGINDVDAGKAVMRELAKAMGDKGGPIAVLAGNQTAPNLQARVKGVKDQIEALKDKGFKLKEVYYHKETAADAAAMVQQVQTANPDIAGWAMVGGWPLFTQNALNGVADKGVKVVSVDHLPQQLDYVKKGQVQALIGQDCYGWGYQSVVMIVEKLVEKKTPSKVVNNFDLSVVTKDNVAQYEGTWQKWLADKPEKK